MRRLTQPSNPPRTTTTLRLARTRRGFNLVEIIVAVFLLSMAVLSFAALYPVSSRASQMSGSYSQAISVVQHKVDQLRAVGYGGLDYTNLVNTQLIDASPGTSPYHYEGVDGLSADLSSAVGTIVVSDYASSLKRVDVSVTWKDTVGNTQKSRSHAVTILIGRSQ